MWRGSYNEDWERQRELITRTLFHDLPLLSPVAEEADSESAHSVCVPPSSIEAWKLDDDVTRPWSPLPPLIIEREPNRHDEPQEYYHRLARKMRRLHRKLFIENRSLDTTCFELGISDSLTKSSSVEPHSKTSMVEELRLSSSPSSSANFEVEPSTADAENTSVTDENGDTNCIDLIQINSSVNQEQSNHSTTNKTIEDEKDSKINSVNQERSGLPRTEDHINTSSNDRGVNTSSSNNGHYRQVTVLVDVHRDASVEDGDSSMHQDRVSEDNGSRCGDALLEKTRVSDILITRVTSAHLDIREMEVMRTPRVTDARTSFATTFLQQPQEASSESLSPEAAIHSPEHYNDFDILKDTSCARDILTEIEQCSEDFNITLQSSTPKISKRRRMSAENISGEYSRSSSPKRIRYDSVATQCDKMEWSSFRANFFVGTPQIYNLCSCRNHRCVC